jgi:hypothetical protein
MREARARSAVGPRSDPAEAATQILSGSSSPSQESTLVAQLNGDAFLDVVTIHDLSTEHVANAHVRLQAGNGDGTFGLVQTLAVPSSPFALSGKLADFNRDGRLDLVWSGVRKQHQGTTGTWVHFNLGGSFAQPVHYETPVGVHDVADYDSDGDIDLLGGGYPNLVFGLNNGTGAFTEKTEMITPYAMTITGDWTGNGGAPDLLVPKGTYSALLGLYRNSQ